MYVSTLVESWDHVYYSDKPFFPLDFFQIEGKPSPNSNTKVVRARLEKVTYLCTQSDYYVVVSHSQTA